MSKIICFSLVVLLGLTLFFDSKAQPPEGKLVFHTAASNFNIDGAIGYIEYPSASFRFLDSLTVNDLAATSEYLFTAGDKISQYSLNTNALIDTTNLIQARQLSLWNDKLIAAHQAQPHLRIFNQTDLSYASELDTALVREMPVDLKVEGDLLYLLFTNRIQAYDLLTHDTLASVAVIFAPNFSMSATHLVAHPEKLIVDIDYFTAVPRYGMNAMNRSTMEVDSLFHGIYLSQYIQPVVAQNKVYTLNYPTHYDLDSNRFFPSALDSGQVFGLPQAKCIAYDSVSNALFVQYPDSSIVYFDGTGIPQQELRVNGFVRQSAFIPDSSAVLGLMETTISNEFEFDLSPNPASDELYVHFQAEKRPESIEITDAAGRLIWQRQGGGGEDRQFIDLSGFTAGHYYVSLHFGEHHTTRSLIVN